MHSDVDLIEKDNLVADNSCSQSIEITFVAESRSHSRIDEFIPAEAITESGEMVVGIIIEISFSGLRLSGNRLMVDTLLPNSNLKDKHLPVRVSFVLPGASAHSISPKIRCDTVYSRNLEEDICQIGMQFIEFEEGATELVEYLISKGLA